MAKSSTSVFNSKLAKNKAGGLQEAIQLEEKPKPVIQAPTPNAPPVPNTNLLQAPNLTGTPQPFEIKNISNKSAPVASPLGTKVKVNTDGTMDIMVGDKTFHQDGNQVSPSIRSEFANVSGNPVNPRSTAGSGVASPVETPLNPEFASMIENAPSLQNTGNEPTLTKANLVAGGRAIVKGAGVGSALGSSVGGTIGSVVLPGLGTAIGTAIGAGVGVLVGGVLGGGLEGYASITGSLKQDRADIESGKYSEFTFDKSQLKNIISLAQAGKITQEQAIESYIRNLQNIRLAQSVIYESSLKLTGSDRRQANTDLANINSWLELEPTFRTQFLTSLANPSKSAQVNFENTQQIAGLI